MISRLPRLQIANLVFAVLTSVACERPPASPQPASDPYNEPEPPQLTDSSAEAQTATELEPNLVLEGALAPGESHLYSIAAAENQYLHVVVDQQGIDIAATLEGPSGEPLLRMDRPISDHGPEHILVVTQEAGSHRLQVAARDGFRPAGRYVVRLVELRPASDTDYRRAKGARLYSEAWDYHRNRDYEEGAERFRESLALWEELDDLPWQGESLIMLGLSQALRREWLRALPFFQEAASVLEKTDNARLQAIALHQIGLTYLYLRKLEPAIRSFREAVPLRQKAEARRGEALTYHSLGQAFQIQDQVQQALDYYAQALALFNRPQDRAPSIHNRGVLFLSMGKMDQARDALIEAHELSTMLEDRQRQATTLNQLGELHRGLGELDTALGYFEQALALRRQLKNQQRGQANSLANIGRVLQARGEHLEALAYYQDALKILDGLQQPWLVARILLNLGSLYLEQDSPESAMEVFEQSLDLYRGVGDPTGEAEGLLGIARGKRHQGKLAEAIEASKEALHIFESIRPRAVRHDLRSSFFATIQQHLEFHIDLLIQLHQLEQGRGYDAQALQVSEQARARSLLDLLIEAGTEIRSGADPELLNRERAIQGQLNALERQRRGMHESGLQEPKKLEAVERSIRLLLETLAETQARIRTYHPRYAELEHGTALSAGAIQRKVLDDETLLLEYWLGEKRSFLWAVTPNSLDVFELAGRETIERQARLAYLRLTQSHRQEAKVGTRDTLCALSQLVLAPAAGHLAGKRLLIVAAGALQFIPFAALPEPTGDDHCLDAKPMLVEHEVTYLPSASALPILRRGLERPAAATRSVAVVADPVFSVNDERVSAPTEITASQRSSIRSSGDVDLSSFQRLFHSGLEAKAISAFTEPDEHFEATGFDANKETVTGGLLAGSRFIHLATHGILDTNNPELSGIVLSLVDRQGQPQDGFLRAHEIYNLNLACDLVVLSACKTALGKEVRGEGLIGLTRGFMYAGAARAMVSLWNVNDERTAELMEVFYRGLLHQDLPPAAALRAAQIAMLSNAPTAAPYFWASFVIQGDWR